jgi:acetyl-CoA synthetase
MTIPALGLLPGAPDFATASLWRSQAAQNPDEFWRRVGERLDWSKPFTTVGDWSFAQADFHVRWYADGELNLCVNALDRHLPTRAAKTAIIWEGDDAAQQRQLTYGQLHTAVCQFANALSHLGIGKGDRVAIYLPQIPEAAIAMLACARIGAIHCVVFGGFSAESLSSRIADCGCKMVITADASSRGGKRIALKENVDAALQKPGTQSVQLVVVVRHAGVAVDMHVPRDRWYHSLVAGQESQHVAQAMNAEDPLFILYTSGSTGKPKGVLHTCGGYGAYASFTHATIFDLKENDVYWCTADIGWITGHSYVVYGPLINGATTLMFEGVPNWPNAERFWQIVDRYQVSIFYTAPTAIRALMREGDEPVRASSRKSLRLLGTVGEPINPAAWQWYFDVVGDARCPIVDTWWQTENGGILISPWPTTTPLKPGAAMSPLPGIAAVLVDTAGTILDGAAGGNLLLATSWPGQMRGVWGDSGRFFDTYFKAYPGFYFTGDGARRDVDGDYVITGRVDDVINVSGHRLGTAEIESALVAHAAAAEAAVVGFAHDIKGQGIYAFVTLKAGVSENATLREELKSAVRVAISAIATPDVIHFAKALPKTRSGKIMRRILRKIAAGETDQLGDVSTLADPTVVAELLLGMPQH